MSYVVYKGCSGYVALKLLGKCCGLLSWKVKYIVAQFSDGKIAHIPIKEIGKRAIIDTRKRTNGWTSITSKMKRESIKLANALPLVGLDGQYLGGEVKNKIWCFMNIILF